MRKPMCASTTGATAASGSGYPLANLFACEVAVSSYYSVHSGAIAYLTSDKPNCPSSLGWQRLQSALGRTLVAMDPGQYGAGIAANAVGDYGVLAGGPALVQTNAFTQFSHTHNVSTTAQLSGTANVGNGAAPIVSTIPLGSASAPTPTAVTGALGASSNNLPFQKLAVCEPQSGYGVDTTAALLPSGSLVFYNRNVGCPTTGGNWLPVYDYTGRLIVVRARASSLHQGFQALTPGGRLRARAHTPVQVAPSLSTSGINFGSDAPLAGVAPNGTAPGHVHASFAGASVTQGSTCGSDYAQNGFASPGASYVLGHNGGAASYSVDAAATSDVLNDVQVPYAGFILCRQTLTFTPSQAPTMRPSASPTHRPTTKSPTTKAPSTTTSPSSRPTSAAPTGSPTSQPTRRPTSAAPSSHPTAKPVTATPTMRPVSSSPSARPSSSPTRLPTRSPSTSQPSSAPAFSAPSRSPTSQPSRAPLASAPSSAPQSARPSSAPVVAPSAAPVVAAPPETSAITVAAVAGGTVAVAALVLSAAWVAVVIVRRRSVHSMDTLVVLPQDPISDEQQPRYAAVYSYVDAKRKTIKSFFNTPLYFHGKLPMPPSRAPQPPPPGMQQARNPMFIDAPWRAVDSQPYMEGSSLSSAGLSELI